jgi:hypothetical protein
LWTSIEDDLPDVIRTGEKYDRNAVSSPNDAGKQLIEIIEEIGTGQPNVEERVIYWSISLTRWMSIAAAVSHSLSESDATKD